MKLDKAKALAKELIQQHNLTDWTFVFSDAKRTFGWCSFRLKTIKLSKTLTLLNEEPKVKDTILHEIAHALTPNQSHNHVWKEKALEIGCNGKRCYGKEVITPEPKYKYKCPNCDYISERFRKTKRKMACKQCCDKYNQGRFTKKYLFKLLKLGDGTK